MACLNLSPYASEELSSTSLCVYNLSDVDLFFVLRLDDNVSRAANTLSTGDRLCLQGDSTQQPGAVAVFENQFAIEGCTKLAKTGQVHILIDYSSFDNCTWQ